MNLSGPWLWEQVGAASGLQAEARIATALPSNRSCLLPRSFREAPASALATYRLSREKSRLMSAAKRSGSGLAGRFKSRRTAAELGKRRSSDLWHENHPNLR